jgi:hypothetical protein
VWWLIVLVLLLAPGCGRRTAVDVVDRFEVDILLEPDGSAAVRERIGVRNSGAADAVFERRLGSPRTDAFLDVTASSGPSSAAASGDAGEVAIDSGGTPAIRWRVPPASGATRILELGYRAAGVVEIQGMRGTFSWPALPADRPYDIATASVSLRLPPGTRLLQPPQVDAPEWQWTTTSDGLVARKTKVARTESAILTATLALDAVPMLEPRWQTRAAFGQQLTPAFIAAGLFILVTAAGILWAIRLQLRGSRDADLSRREAARGLRIAGLAVVVLGMASAVLAYALLRSLGPWSQAVPVSLVLSGVWFVAAGTRLRPRTQNLELRT